MLQKGLSLFFCFLSIIIFIFNYYNIGLLFSLLSYLLILVYTLKTAGFNSILFLFLVLFGLYGYSVPVSIIFDLDIGWHRVAKLSSWQKVDNTLYSYLISNQIALFAIIILSIFFINKKTMNSPHLDGRSIKYSYFKLSLISGYIASFCALLDFIRVGGFSAVSRGKAFYQGAVNDLVLNIPYDGFFFISTALFALFISNIKNRVGLTFFISQYFFAVSFVFLINLIIGERGLLVVGIVIFFLGLFMKSRLRKVKIKYIFVLSILYLLFNTLTLLREKDIEYKNLKFFFSENKEKLLSLMNPANTEFAASAFNYRIFYHNKSEDFEFKFGKTYTEVLVAFFPTYVYPNKPKSIIYEFRDTYFPERKKMGSTAGTGFSSLMEAYMNFGYIGPFIVYFIFVFLIIYLENKRRKNSLYVKVFYLLFFNVILIFSRSASQYILFTLILYLLQVLLVAAVYKLTPKKVFSFSNKLSIDEEN